MRGIAFRSWFYFRTGMVTYIAMILGIVNVLTTTYYLIPAVEEFFPDFVTYIIIVAAIGTPATIGIGVLHFKKSQAFGSEMDIMYESNPYWFKLPPGHNLEAMYPAYLEILRLSMKVAKHEDVTEEDEKKFKELEKKLEHLVKGGDIRKI